VIAPDYPGYGHSSMPTHDTFSYTFDNLAKGIDDSTKKDGLKKYAMYVQDNRLSVILSKALPLADDITITDASIRSQIRRSLTNRD
jgi:hypothetical protein